MSFMFLYLYLLFIVQLRPATLFKYFQLCGIGVLKCTSSEEVICKIFFEEIFYNQYFCLYFMPFLLQLSTPTH
jgi:hypothetical protein